MEQPPTEGEKLPICLKVITICLFCPIVIMVFEAYGGVVWMVRSERDNAREIVAPAEKVELYPRKKGKEGKRVY